MRFSLSFGPSLVYLVTFDISWDTAFPVWLWKVSMELRFIPRQCIKKRRHYFADKCSYSQSCGFSNSSSSSVSQSCLTLCNPMNRSMPGLLQWCGCLWHRSSVALSLEEAQNTYTNIHNPEGKITLPQKRHRWAAVGSLDVPLLWLPPAFIFLILKKYIYILKFGCASLSCGMWAL